MAATHLADTSALLELHQPQRRLPAGRSRRRRPGGHLRCRGPGAAGLGAGPERVEVLEERRFFPRVTCDDRAIDRAIAVQALLGDPAPTSSTSWWQPPRSWPGWCCSTTDGVFERIAAVTGQPVERARLTGALRANSSTRALATPIDSDHEIVQRALYQVPSSEAESLTSRYSRVSDHSSPPETQWDSTCEESVERSVRASRATSRRGTTRRGDLGERRSTRRRCAAVPPRVAKEPVENRLEIARRTPLLYTATCT